jgi:hypothetical protein
VPRVAVHISTMDLRSHPVPLKDAPEMKIFTAKCVEAHLLGKHPYRTMKDLKVALELLDPNRKPWERQRLEYQIMKGRKTLATRSAEGSPYDGNFAEGFLVDDGDIDLSVFDQGTVAPPETNTGGGRPKGTTLEASRKLKKVKAQLLDSVTKAWDAAKNENGHDGEIFDGAAGPSRRCVGLGVLISEKTEKYIGLFPVFSRSSGFKQSDICWRKSAKIGC